MIVDGDLLSVLLLKKLNGQCFRRASGAQLLRLPFLGVLEIIVGLYEEEPGTLPIADRVCLF